LLNKKNNSPVLKSIPDESLNTPSKIVHRQIIQNSNNLTPRKLNESKTSNIDNEIKFKNSGKDFALTNNFEIKMSNDKAAKMWTNSCLKPDAHY